MIPGPPNYPSRSSPRLIPALLVILAGIATVASGQIKVPEKPESRVVDEPDYLPGRVEEDVSRMLRDLDRDAGISLYMVILEEEPAIRPAQFARHIVSNWGERPISAVALTYPGCPDGFYLATGGKGLPRKSEPFVKKAVSEAMERGQLERDVSMKIMGVASTFCEGLREVQRDIVRLENNPEYGQIEVEEVSLTERFPFLRPKIWVPVLAGLVGLGLLVLILLWARGRRKRTFPDVDPRLRFGGRYSGGSNIRVSFRRRGHG